MHVGLISLSAECRNMMILRSKAHHREKSTNSFRYDQNNRAIFVDVHKMVEEFQMVVSWGCTIY